jgi:tRNA(adenine34) deaminase
MDCQVARELEKLKGASDEQLRGYDRNATARRLQWYREQQENLNLPGDRPLESAYRLLLRKLGIRADEAPIVEKSKDRIVLHSRNFCPTLEACKILKLDTRRVCRLYNEGSTRELIRQIDPRLNFSRNYEKLRPYADYCEEVIEYRKNRGERGRPGLAIDKA